MKKLTRMADLRLPNDDLWLANQSRAAMNKLARAADNPPNDGLWLANRSPVAVKKPAKVADGLPNDGLQLANQSRIAVKKPTGVRFVRPPNDRLSLAK